MKSIFVKSTNGEMKNWVIPFLCTLLLPGLLAAQEFVVNSRLLTVSDGMVSRNARAVTTDLNSNIWIATDLGVTMFDGLEVGVPEDLPEKISDIRFDFIHCSKNGMLWFVDEEPTLVNDSLRLLVVNFVVYDPIEKRIINPLSDLPDIQKIIQDQKGKLWIWTAKNKLYSYEDQLKFEQQVPTYGLTSMQEIGEVRYFFYQNRMDARINNALAKSIRLKYAIVNTFLAGDGSVYFANSTSIVDPNVKIPVFGKFDPNSGLVTYSNVNDEKLPARYNINPLYFTEFNDQISFFYQKNFYIIDRNDLSLNTGIPLVEIENPVQVNGGAQLGENTFSIASSEGLLLVELMKNHVKNYFAQESYSLRGISRTDKDSLFVSTYSGAIVLDNNSNESRFLKNRDKILFGIAAFDEESLIAGTHGNYYFLINKRDKRLELKELSNTSNKNLLSLLPFRLQNDELWMGTSKGPFKYSREDTQFYKPPQIASTTLDQLPIRSISFEDEEYFFCTEKGLYISGTDLSPKLYEPIGTVIVTDVHIDTECRWISTFGKGLNRIDNTTGEISKFNQKTIGFSNDYIYSIHDDGLGYLWLPTNNGLIRFEKSSLSFQTFLPENGFANYEYNNGSAFVDDDGQVFYGGTDGMSSFYPSSFLENSAPISFRISKMNFTQPDGVSISISYESERVDLPANYLSYSLSIHSENYAIEGSIKYIYKIPEYSNEWTPIDNNNLTLNRLPFGNHSIIIKPLMTGHRSAKLINIDLKVRAPFYLQLPFLLISAFSLILLTILYIRWRTNQLRKRNLMLSTQVKERTHELSTRNKDLVELNETRDRLFGIIAHDLRGPLIGFKDIGQKFKFLKERKREADLEKLTNTVQENYENLTSLLDNLLNWISAQRGRLPINILPISLDTHIDETLRLYDQTIKHKNIKIIREGPSVKILADEDGLDILLRNLISNAIKYSETQGRIWISSFENTEEATLVIEDEGVGIGEEELKNLFQVKSRRGRQGTRGEKSTGLGLPLCKEFVTLMGGRIEVKSELGKGTRLSISFPKHIVNDKLVMVKDTE